MPQPASRAASVTVVDDSRQAELQSVARAWRVDLPAVRRGLETEASSLARPRLWVDTVGPLAATSWRMISIAAPDAPIALLSAAAAAAGLPIGPPSESWGVLRRAQRLVRGGGPTYIKLGQFIASARGLLPDSWVDAFA